MPIEEFRKKHHSEYEELLMCLGLSSLDRMMLKVCGIKSLKIYSICGRRYYCCLTYTSVKPIVKLEVFGNKPREKGTECYILTVALCDHLISYESLKKDYDDLSHEHLEYTLLIKDRKVWFGLVTMEKEKFEVHLIAIFLYTVGRLIDVDAISVLVPTSDTVFLEALKASGYTIVNERTGCYNVTKETLKI